MRPISVMVVDDVEILRRRIKRLPLWQEDTGFFIQEEAEDGEEALEKLRKNPVDLLITDIKMPKVDGMELLKRVCEEHLASFVVFLSDYAEFHLAKEAIACGIFDYLVKPVKEEELRILLSRVKEQVAEKEKAVQREKQLSEKLLEKTMVYDPEEDFKQLLERVVKADASVIVYAQQLAEKVFSALEEDLTKTAMVLEKETKSFLGGLFQRCPWMAWMVKEDLKKPLSYRGDEEAEEILSQFVEKIHALWRQVKRFLRFSDRSPLIEELCQYVLHHVEEKLTMETLSEVFYLSKNHIGDLFKEHTGTTLGSYITFVKMERAKILLDEGILKNYEISERLKYNNMEYFSKLFKKNTGMTPTEYREKAQ